MQVKTEDGKNYVILTAHEWALATLVQVAGAEELETINMMSPDTYILADDTAISYLSNLFARYDYLVTPFQAKVKLVMEGNRGVIVKE